MVLFFCFCFGWGFCFVFGLFVGFLAVFLCFGGGFPLDLYTWNTKVKLLVSCCASRSPKFRLRRT